MKQTELIATILAGIYANPKRALSGHAHDNVAVAIEYADELQKQLKEKFIGSEPSPFGVINEPVEFK